VLYNYTSSCYTILDSIMFRKRFSTPKCNIIVDIVYCLFILSLTKEGNGGAHYCEDMKARSLIIVKYG